MITIRDVARYAKVSVATVSRVINNKGSVSDSTRRKVKDAVKELDYQPNDMARTFYSGKSKMIALLVPDIQNPFFPELARGVEDGTNEAGYTFILCNTDNNIKKEENYLNVLMQKKIDGIIGVSNTSIGSTINTKNIPFIALDRQGDENVLSIIVNNREGSRQAVIYLRSLECKTIAHICGPNNEYNAKQRMKGYLDIVQDEEWFSSKYIKSGNYDFHHAFESTIELLKDYPEIDGIFAGNDLMGIGVLKAAESLGIKVPDDLSVIGFDGINLGEKTSPSLTTMAQPIYEIGEKSTELLIEQIRNPKEKFDFFIEYKVDLIKRNSTRKKI